MAKQSIKSFDELMNTFELLSPVFRYYQHRNLVAKCNAKFKGNGGTWKVDAVHSITKWLKENLSEDLVEVIA